jgi:adenine C2-methylase RlmN of 23S rRNA A2503 and tRNA A37
MNGAERIQQEKLENILNPKTANRQFKVTVRFEKHLSARFEEALELARGNETYLEEQVAGSVRYYVTFQPQDVDRLYELFERVKDQESTVLFLNNKRIPYIQDLWLFLMWFYRVH